MDEAAWLSGLSDAILLCKGSGSTQQGPLEGFNEEHHSLDCLNQYTDISNSFIENNEQYRNNNTSSNSSLSHHHHHHHHHGNIGYSNKHPRLGLTGLGASATATTVLQADEFIDLEDIHSNNSNIVQAYDDNRRCSSNAHSIPMTQVRCDNVTPHHAHQYHQRHHFMSNDHNHRHYMDFNLGEIMSQYNNTGHDTSSSSSSCISLTSSAHHHNISCSNNSNSSTSSQRHNAPGSSSYSLRTHGHSNTTRGEDSKSDCETYVQNFPFSYSNTDPESTSDSELQRLEDSAKQPPYPVRRRPGRPRGLRRKKPEKLGRLWEFIRDLLLDPQSCPSLICWDNYEEGMFRFVHSDKVAKLWGAKRDNPDMNYEKLSRAMRYYYKSNVLQPVFGRRLVYKFGPEARGWKTTNPNFTC